VVIGLVPVGYIILIALVVFLNIGVVQVNQLYKQSVMLFITLLNFVNVVKFVKTVN
jgi:hypothetical protein